LRGLGRDAELGTDALPREPCAARGTNGVCDLTLATGMRQSRPTQEVLGNAVFVFWRGLVVLEPLGELVGVVKDVLH